jgi:hypothetical protein
VVPGRIVADVDAPATFTLRIRRLVIPHTAIGASCGQPQPLQLRRARRRSPCRGSPPAPTA